MPPKAGIQYFQRFLDTADKPQYEKRSISQYLVGNRLEFEIESGFLKKLFHLMAKSQGIKRFEDHTPGAKG